MAAWEQLDEVMPALDEHQAFAAGLVFGAIMRCLPDLFPVVTDLKGAADGLGNYQNYCDLTLHDGTVMRVTVDYPGAVRQAVGSVLTADNLIALAADLKQ